MRQILIVLVIALLVGGLVGWWLTRRPDSPPLPVQNVVETPAEQPTNESEAAPPITIEPVAPVETAAVPTGLGEVTAANWEEHLDQILGSDKIDEDAKAEKLADMIPKLPEPAQKELAEHLVNLVADENYAKTAAILKSEKTPASVSQVLLDDLFNRDDELRLPLILDMAQNEQHPLKGEAKEMLEMSVQEDFGTNWVEWKGAVDKVLKGELP